MDVNVQLRFFWHIINNLEFYCNYSAIQREGGWGQIVIKKV